APGLAGCQLLVAPQLEFAYLTDGTGQALLGFNASALAPGTTLFFQAWSLDFDLRADPPAFGSFSAGRAVTFAAPSNVVPGDVVVTEFIKDPEFSSDSAGEWIELESRTDVDLDLRGWTLSDDGFDATVLTSSEPILLPAGGRIVLGNSDDPLALGGLAVDFVYATDNGQFNLGNGADEIVLTTFDGIEADRVAYDAGVLWPDPSGAALALHTGAIDNNDPANWAVADCFIGGAPFNTDRGTPGADNALCANPAPPPGTGGVLVTEVLANPSAVSDFFGEYFEVTNLGPGPVDLAGWQVCTAGVCLTLDGPLLLGGDESLVFAVDDDANLNGGLPEETLELADSQFLSNSGGSVQLVDASGQVASLVRYGTDVGLPVVSGVALVLDPDATSSLDPADWCLANMPFASGDLGSPGQANSSCP
ncbi:MAG: lamin tail domain-containing protein, partial [Planctomycetota bacterium]